MTRTELQDALQEAAATGDSPVHVLDEDGFWHDVRSVYWDPEEKALFINTTFTRAEECLPSV